MEQVFFVEPMIIGLFPNGMYQVVRLNKLTNQYEPTAYHHLTKEQAEEKAQELNKNYNEKL